MRDLFRLIAVGAMSLAVVGLAMFYSGGGSLISAARAAGLIGPKSAIAAVVARVGADSTDRSEQMVGLALPHPNHWVGLAGLPGQAEVAFALPQGDAFTSGSLELVFDTYLSAGHQGLMGIWVNGTVRGQLVLEQGQARQAVAITLSEEDLAQQAIALRLAGRPVGKAEDRCPAEAAAVVTLAPESHLALVRAESATSRAARPTVSDPETDRAVALVSMTEGAALSLAQMGADIAVKTFRGSQKWVVNFSDSGLPEDDLGSQLALSLMTTPLAAGQDWLLRVSLNGNLVQTQRFSGNRDRLNLTLDMPVHHLEARNQLGIELVDATPRRDTCGQAEQLQAQLLGESTLTRVPADTHAVRAR